MQIAFGRVRRKTALPGLDPQNPPKERKTE